MEKSFRNSNPSPEETSTPMDTYSSTNKTIIKRRSINKGSINKKSINSRNTKRKRSPSLDEISIPMDTPIYTSNNVSLFKRVKRSLIKSVTDIDEIQQFLTRVCPNLEHCISFGNNYNGLIKRLFNNFINFDYTNSNMVRIGSVTVNGVIYKITYTYENKYTVYCVLKTQSRMTSGDELDNLYYEFLVGYYFINFFNLRFPCFVETYGIYNIPHKTWFNMTEPSSTSYDVNILRETSTLLDDKNTQKYRKNIRDLCLDSRIKLGILIQHIEGETFSDYYKSIIFISGKFNTYFFLYELMQLLFQIYGPLSTMRNCFTHYDLHLKNVLLYDVGVNKYIQMKYVYRDEDEEYIVSFKTRKICKIIDYGRSFFNNNYLFDFKLKSKLKPNDRRTLTSRTQTLFKSVKKTRSLSSRTYFKNSIDTLNSQEILRILKSYNTECPNDGKTKGYKFIKFILDRNVDSLFIMNCITWIIVESQKIKKDDNITVQDLLADSELNDSEKELITYFFSEYGKIKSVSSVYSLLEEILRNPVFTTENNKMYTGHSCVGTMTIYLDGTRPLLYEPN
uniref:Protein kinase domain-containing protein n=1 Tax=viral metagenome TaxID=1070528 RepID=A0A6C0HTE5_9ZZZZ